MMDEVMNKAQERFTFGATEEGSFRFCGRKIVDTEDYISVSSPETLSKVKPIHIDGGRQREPSSPASVSEQSQMRAVLGSIGWVARLCRPELCYGCSSLQGKQAKPMAEDLRNTNKLLASAQKTKDNGVRFVKGKFDLEEAILLSVTDASHAAEVSVTEDGKTQGHRSQSGRFLLLAGAAPTVSQPAWCHVLEWQSQTLKSSLPFDFAGGGFELYAGIGISPTGADSSLLLEVPTHSWCPWDGMEDSGCRFETGAVVF